VYPNESKSKWKNFGEKKTLPGGRITRLAEVTEDIEEIEHPLKKVGVEDQKGLRSGGKVSVRTDQGVFVKTRERNTEKTGGKILPKCP